MTDIFHNPQTSGVYSSSTPVSASASWGQGKDGRERGNQSGQGTSSLPRTSNPIQTPNIARNFVRIAKVGIAMAVIKSAPPGVDGEAYARELCSRYQKSQLKYKEHALRLEREALSLRQQLLEIQTQRLKTETGGGPITTNHSQTSTTEMPQEEEAELGDLFPTPPSSSVERDTSREVRLSQHMSFLRHYMKLRNLTNLPSGVRQEWQGVGRSTLLQMVSMLKASLDVSSSLYLSPALFTRTVHTLVSLVESGACHTYWNEASVELGHLINVLLLNMLHNQDVNKYGRQCCLRQLVVDLSCCTLLRPAIVRLLTYYIREYTSYLRQVKSGGATFLPATYENMYHVVWCLDHVIQQERGHLVGEAGVRLREELEESLLHITDTFPLFSTYIWHVMGRLQQLHEHQTAQSSDKGLIENSKS